MANNKTLKIADNVFFGLTAALIWFPPFALGAVHPWPSAIAEVLAALLLIVLAIKRAARPVLEMESEIKGWRLLCAPVFLLAGLFIFQLVPLPPAVIGILSPSTYNIYERSFESWPQREAYADLTASLNGPATATEPLVRYLPGIGEATSESGSAFGPPIRPSEAKLLKRPAESIIQRRRFSPGDWLPVLGVPATWYPLALSPSLTLTALLRFTSYAGLLLAILTYPFDGGTKGEARFYRRIIVTALLTGLLLASTGLIERVFWNGKILWFFVPWDWGAPLQASLPRATGPFVNPDHFANYLAMIFPLAMAVTLWGFPFELNLPRETTRIAAGVISFVILVAIVLSLSRAAWIGTATSSVVLLLVWAKAELGAFKGTERHSRRRKFVGQRTEMGRSGMARHEDQAAHSGILARQGVSLLAALAAVPVMILLVLYVAGPESRADAGARIAQTVADDGGIGIRPSVWKSTLKMALDFPVFGVGLASWPEVYPHYAAPPWNPYYLREAHNDYLQYVAETGLAGTALLLVFVVATVSTFCSSLRNGQPGERSMLVALVLALGTMALHEMVDFSLHVPANALFFTILLGLALRMRSRSVGRISQPSSQRSPALFNTCGMVVASGLYIALALAHRGLAYPYNIDAATTPVRSREEIMLHPASAAGHIDLVSTDDVNLSPAQRLSEVICAEWLDPTNPWIRDTGAKMFMETNKSDVALREIRTSVFNSPSLATHFYLVPQARPWLNLSEQEAVRQGLSDAVSNHYAGAIENLASFYDTLGDFSNEALLYISAAADPAESKARARYLLGAAQAESNEGNVTDAGKLYMEAIKLVPSDTNAYEELIQRVYTPERNLTAAIAVVARGISDGADAVQLELALASAADSSGDEGIAERSLLKAIQFGPSFDSLMRAGQFYLQRGRFDHAASILESATEAKPASPEAFYLLGVAEERDYQYWSADKAYAHAAALAPSQFGPTYAAFRRRIGIAKSNS